MSTPLHDPLLAAEELVKVTNLLASERNIERLLDLLLSSARTLARAEAGCIYVLDATHRRLLPRTCQNDRVSGAEHHHAAIDLFINGQPNNANPCAYAAFLGQPVSIKDAYVGYSGFHCTEQHRFDQLTGYRTGPMLLVPMRDHQGHTNGVLQLVNHRPDPEDGPRPFPPTLHRVITAFAAQAAVALDNARLISENRRLVEVLEGVNHQLEEENRRLRLRVPSDTRFEEIVGDGPAMRRVFRLIEKVVDSTVTVLVRGETGTGKDLVAAAIHRNGNRASGPFIAQNCAAIPEGVLESELFGHRKGAFTDASGDKKGLIEAADGGTLLLDEIGDMPLALQAKLLRVLQEGEVRPIGALQPIKVDVRFIAATNRDLEGAIRDGRFRQDLYYRLSVFPIDLPPLRERTEDIPALLQHFLSRYAARYQRKITGYAQPALELLLNHPYPGNVRELMNLVERAVLLCDDDARIQLNHIPAELTTAQPHSPGSDDFELNGEGLKSIVGRFESKVIETKLRECKWNQTKTAKALGIGRRTLLEKLERYGIQRKEAR